MPSPTILKMYQTESDNFETEFGNIKSKTEKKESKNVRFDKVDIFYFDRQQGFCSIPNTGLNTLGMTREHQHQEKYTIEEYLNFKRKTHLDIIENNKTAKKILIENFKNRISETGKNVTGIDLKTNDILLDINRDLPINSELFCPILTPQQRSRIIKLISNTVDDTESEEIKTIRKSRENCGCSCKSACVKETCSCFINEIGCQIDKNKFPCSCLIKKCSNPFGLKRFDLQNVREHYDEVLYKKEPCSNKKRKLVDTEEEYGKKEKSKRKIKKPKISEEVEIANNSLSINKCLDLIPYEGPLDLFKFIFKCSNEPQMISC